MKWVPGLKNLKFDASVFGNFSQVNEQNNINFTPEDYDLDGVTVTFTNDESQYMTFEANSYTYGLIVSKKLGVLTVFGGIGQSSIESYLDLKGKYPVITTATNGDLVITDEEALIDPISIKYTSKNMLLNGGLNCQLGFFGIFASVSKAHYVAYNAGISFGYK